MRFLCLPRFEIETVFVAGNTGITLYSTVNPAMLLRMTLSTEDGKRTITVEVRIVEVVIVTRHDDIGAGLDVMRDLTVEMEGMWKRDGKTERAEQYHGPEEFSCLTGSVAAIYQLKVGH